MMIATVHYCDLAQQPDIHIHCMNLWTTPDYKEVDPESIFKTIESLFYTFDTTKVTCFKCLVGISCLKLK
jgi:hypothetical protein